MNIIFFSFQENTILYVFFAKNKKKIKDIKKWILFSLFKRNTRLYFFPSNEKKNLSLSHTHDLNRHEYDSLNDHRIYLFRKVISPSLFLFHKHSFVEDKIFQFYYIYDYISLCFDADF